MEQRLQITERRLMALENLLIEKGVCTKEEVNAMYERTMIRPDGLVSMDEQYYRDLGRPRD